MTTTTPATERPSPPAAEDTRRAGYIAGLRRLADVLEAHPDIPLPYHGSWAGITIHYLHDEDARANMAAAARAFGGTWDKTASEGERSEYFDLTTKLAGGLLLELTAYRSAVCERVVVGVETVTKQVPDPAAPLVEVSEVVETVQWKCAPVLEAVAR